MTRVIRILATAFVLLAIVALTPAVPSHMAATPVIAGTPIVFPCDGPCHGGKLVPTFPPSKIQHVIVIVQENRTPDDLFHAMKAKGANIADYGYNSKGVKVTLVPTSLASSVDPGHRHMDFETEYAGGAMNGWDKVAPSVFAYVPKKQVLPYYTLAETYTFADNTFQDNQGPSFPAHQFLIAGTSIDKVGSKYMAAENLNYLSGTWENGPNCDGPKTNRVQTINPVTGDETTAPQVMPCFEHPTIMDLLDAKSVSWRYYNHVSGGYWSAPDAIKHLRYGPDWANVIVPAKTIITDISSGKLAQVSWVIPSAAESDHGGTMKKNGAGAAWVASIVNAVGASKYWSSTAIFITWDDWGGWFDHVKPPIYNQYEIGFRVPLIVVSPYAKLAYISHVQHQQSSILHFIETNFNLGTLGYADERADNLADCFNFMQPPTPFVKIATPGWTARDVARLWAPSNAPPDDY